MFITTNNQLRPQPLSPLSKREGSSIIFPPSDSDSRWDVALSLFAEAAKGLGGGFTSTGALNSQTSQQAKTKGSALDAPTFNATLNACVGSFCKKSLFPKPCCQLQQLQHLQRPNKVVSKKWVGCLSQCQDLDLCNISLESFGAVFRSLLYILQRWSSTRWQKGRS